MKAAVLHDLEDVRLEDVQEPGIGQAACANMRITADGDCTVIPSIVACGYSWCRAACCACCQAMLSVVLHHATRDTKAAGR